MALKKACLVALLAYFNTQVNAICQHYNATCPESAPCCSDGWCNVGHNCIATICDPLNSYSAGSCYPKPQCVDLVDTFSRNDVTEFSKFDGNPNGGYEWVSEFIPNHAAVEDGELVLSMPLGTQKNSYGRLQGFGATVTSIRWIQYGNVTARVKTASTSPGVVTSFIIRNPEGDEIDFEWVGGSPDKVQTNYYYNDILDYKNGIEASVGSNTADGFNEYMIQWEEDFIKFWVNKKVIRTVYKKDTWDEKSKVYKYPARLAQVHLGIWDGGRGAPGTMEWAGGPTNWSNPKTVYKAYYNYVNIQCKYSGNSTQQWPTSTKNIASSSRNSSATSAHTSSTVAAETSPNTPAVVSPALTSRPPAVEHVNSAHPVNLGSALISAALFLTAYMYQ
ncbi:concanavalin A-like lectin/glucanase [Basidiobolus meristosporus CBS 931.73]|uniref:Concanavalin A-like lectin/glucanase n=1 Tax=Basidiobolus meristosporus CBS 931.73 TaxID=1314790 RepID=A0A1Y1YD08_9FUNG|nr:concanavalin A-like lectin/glucanase [Basidiobolus meristosporus CBS 931.73]|eukprot:ORX95825.1 concanavalin A-like lectin/glucanase [Basidiobolus meristosporus CBS 931.73]